MGKKFNAMCQHDLFDERVQRWSKLPQSCHETVEELLRQLFIEAIQEHSVIDNQEEDNDAF